MSQAVQGGTSIKHFMIPLLLLSVPGSCNDEVQYPVDKVQAEGANVTYTCLNQDVLATSWTVNGEPYEPHRHGGNVKYLLGGSNLTLPAPSGYSMIQIQCFITMEGPTTLNFSATLYIQGIYIIICDFCRYNLLLALLFNILYVEPLQQVTNLRIEYDDDVVTVAFDPPNSLNLTNIEPDIQYILTIVRSDDEIMQTINSTSPLFKINVSELDSSYLYYILVTPRSNVEGARMGKKSERVHILNTLSKLFYSILTEIATCYVTISKLYGIQM